MRDLIFFVVFAGSWLLAPVALFVLVRRGEYRRALGFGGFMIAVPLLASWVFSLQNPHSRKWLGYPTAFLFVFCVFSAFWLFNAAWDSAPTKPDTSPPEPWFTRRRGVAGVVALSGAALWCAGFWQIFPSGWWEFPVLIGSSSVMLLGAVNFAAD